jgi:transketolase
MVETMIGMNGFGTSAPGPELLVRFGFTTENVQSTALSVLKRLR